MTKLPRAKRFRTDGTGQATGVDSASAVGASMPKFPPRPSAPSVRLTMDNAIARARALSKDEGPLSRQELVKDIDLPASLRAARFKQRHGLEE